MHGAACRPRLGHASPLVCLLLTAVAAAHHTSRHESSEVVGLEGEIVAVAWHNPQVRLVLEVADSSETTTHWTLTGASANVLERWGVGASALPLGLHVTAYGPRSDAGHNEIFAALIRAANQAPILLSPQLAGRLGLADIDVSHLFPPPRAATNSQSLTRGLFRVWTPRAGFGMNAANLPLTAAGRATANRYDPRLDDPALRCEPPGMPAMLETRYPIEFVDRGDRILMRFEEWDGERTIYMNPGQGPPVQEPSRYGVSFGRWEQGGATLAVFTLYIDYPFLDRHGTPQSSAVTVLERYTPRADGALDWLITVTDAATFTEPVVHRGHMIEVAGEAVKRFDCRMPDNANPA